DVEDTALVQFEFERGATASVQLDYLQQPPAHHLTIVGRLGVIQWNNAEGIAILQNHHARYVAAPPEGFERNDLFMAELEHFFDCIDGSDEPLCSLRDGERVMRICLAAKQAALEGRRMDV